MCHDYSSFNGGGAYAPLCDLPAVAVNEPDQVRNSDIGYTPDSSIKFCIFLVGPGTHFFKTPVLGFKRQGELLGVSPRGSNRNDVEPLPVCGIAVISVVVQQKKFSSSHGAVESVDFGRLDFGVQGNQFHSGSSIVLIISPSLEDIDIVSYNHIVVNTFCKKSL